MKLARIFLGRLKALSLYSHHMQKNRGHLVLQVLQQLNKACRIVAIHRANVLEPPSPSNIVEW